jgi:3-deoxy-D-manno-octulosonic acid kinase
MVVPSGFERLLLGHAVAVARSDVAPSIRRALVAADGTKVTLHEYAARHPTSRAYEGRGIAYACSLPSFATGRVVVRHNWHGGLFAPLTRDWFLSPTRAPHELAMAHALARLGIPTPTVMAYVLYPPGAIVQRADVCSLELSGSADLAKILSRDGEPARHGALAATSELVAQLARAGVRHHDLNAKNVLLSNGKAFVLDVDRVALGVAPDAALDANLARLTRSLRKWRDRFGAHVSEADIARLNEATRAAFQGLR